MNFPRKPDSFVLVLAALTDMLVTKESEVGELLAHVERHHLDMDELQRTITDLRTRLDENADYHSEATREVKRENMRLRDQVSNWRPIVERSEAVLKSNEDLCEQVRQLRIDNARLRYGGNNLTETANAYMKNHGAETWEKGEKIATLKVVREITGWDLRQAKEFCENYSEEVIPTMVPTAAFLFGKEEKKEEESGPRTQRSSQVPAGVGMSQRPIQVSVAAG